MRSYVCPEVRNVWLAMLVGSRLGDGLRCGVSRSEVFTRRETFEPSLDERLYQSLSLVTVYLSRTLPLPADAWAV